MAFWLKPSVVSSVRLPKPQFTAIAIGISHSCGIKTDRTVACWGSNHDKYNAYIGQADAPRGRFIAITAG